MASFPETLNEVNKKKDIIMLISYVPLMSTTEMMWQTNLVSYSSISKVFTFRPKLPGRVAL